MGEENVAVGGANLNKPYEVDNTYTWGVFVEPFGTAFTDFLYKLNSGCNLIPDVPCAGNTDCILQNAGECGFAGHRDRWFPEIRQVFGTVELKTILNCSFGSSCIDPIFGPTASSDYWSGTTEFGDFKSVLFVNFDSGVVNFSDSKIVSKYVRAVRTGP